jgi:hypothetical protein
MAIAVHFQPTDLTKEKFDQINAAVEHSLPPQLLYHCAFGEDTHLEVFHIWESQEAFEKFGVSLMPELEKAGVHLTSPPRVLPLYHNGTAE